MSIQILVTKFVDEGGNDLCSGNDCANLGNGQVVSLSSLKCVKCEDFSSNPTLYANCRSFCKKAESEEEFAEILGIDTPEKSIQQIRKTFIALIVALVAIAIIYFIF